MGGYLSSNDDGDTLMDDQLFQEQRDERGHFEADDTPGLKITASLGVKGVDGSRATVTQVLKKGAGQQPKQQKALLRSHISDTPDSSAQLLAADFNDVLGFVTLGDINEDMDITFNHTDVSRGTGQVPNSEQSCQPQLPIVSCGNDKPNGIQGNGCDARQPANRGHQFQQQQAKVSTISPRVPETARLDLLSRDRMQIFVIDIRGKTHTVTVNKTDKVDELMKKIANKTGVHERQQALQHNGKPLQRGRFLTDYGIQKESTIHMTACLRGGYTSDNTEN